MPGGVSGVATTFNVADVTGDANPDFIVNGILRNTPAGTGGFTKTGAGTMEIIRGTSTYSGTVTISAGTLQIGDGTSANDAKLPNGTIVNNAALVFNNSANESYGSTPISGSGSLTKNGTGTLAFDSASNLSYGGTTTLNGGTLDFDFATNLTGNVAVNSGTLQLTDFVGGLGASKLTTQQVDLTAGTIQANVVTHQAVFGLYTDVINIHGSGQTSNIGNGTAMPIWIDAAGDTNPHTLTLTVDTGATGIISSVIGNHPTLSSTGSFVKAGSEAR